MSRCACIGCGWAALVTRRNATNPAIEDALDHALAGWRLVPIVQRCGPDTSAKQTARWLHQIAALYDGFGLDAWLAPAADGVICAPSDAPTRLAHISRRGTSTSAPGSSTTSRLRHRPPRRLSRWGCSDGRADTSRTPPRWLLPRFVEGDAMAVFNECYAELTDRQWRA